MSKARPLHIRSGTHTSYRAYILHQPTKRITSFVPRVLCSSAPLSCTDAHTVDIVERPEDTAPAVNDGPDNNLRETDSLSRQRAFLVQMLEACRLSLVFYAAITLAGYGKLLPGYALWGCWVAVAACLPGSKDAWSSNYERVRVSSSSTYMFVGGLIAMGLLARDIALQNVPQNQSIRLSIYLLLALVVVCAFLGFVCACVLSTSQAGTIKLNRDDIDKFVKLQYLYLMYGAGNMVSVTVGALVGGSFVDFMTPLAFWCSVAMTACSFTATQALWLAFDLQGSASQRQKNVFAVNTVAICLIVPSVLLLNGHRYNQLRKPDADCDNNCTARFDELMFCAGCCGCYAAGSALAYLIVPTPITSIYMAYMDMALRTRRGG